MMVLSAGSAVKIECRGFQIGQVAVPPFSIGSSSAVRLVYPVEISAGDALLLEQVFSGKLSIPYLSLAEDLVLSELDLVGNRPALLGRLLPLKAKTLLQRRFDLDGPTACSVLLQSGIEPDQEVRLLSHLQKKLLKLELAYLFNDLLLVATDGLDHEGLSRLYASLEAKLATHPALVLSYPIVGPEGNRIFDIQPGYRDLFVKTLDQSLTQNSDAPQIAPQIDIPRL